MPYSLWLLFAIGSLGALLQILGKIQALKIRSKAANHSFTFKDYFTDDWPAILASFVSVAIAVLCVNELLKIKPALGDYIKWFFVFIGYTGSSLVQAVLSVTGKKLLAVIDIKTNVADGVTPAVDATNIEGLKEIEKANDLTPNS